MKKKGSVLLSVLWGLAVAAIRIVYAILGSQKITDPFGFFSHAMIQEQEREPLLSSGIAYAYTERLSDIFRFTGNRIEVAWFYQNLLLIAWLLLLFFGIKLLWGNTMALVSTLLLTLWPWGALGQETAVECENYLMLYWSLLFLLLGIFQNRVRVSGWTRSNFCELYLILTGFGIGVVTAWNYMGLLLFPVIIYVLAGNHSVMQERAWRKEWQEAETESKQQMSLFSQGSILVAGAFLGMFATLLKYTGLTGYVLYEQFFWWLDQFHNFPERCQDISGGLLFFLAASMAIGAICQAFFKMIQRQIDSKRAFKETESHRKPSGAEAALEAAEVVPEPTAEAVLRQEERIQEQVPDREPEVFKESDIKGPAVEAFKESDIQKPAVEEKKVKLLDNPLPVPKKPEIRDMDFEYTGKESDREFALDFDFAVSEDDDFDV